eukprot:scaffold83173_cov76-Phaeocystis_antarctica.AAC.3
MKKTFARPPKVLHWYQCRLESLRVTRSVLPGRHSQKCIEAKRRYTSRYRITSARAVELIAGTLRPDMVA